MRHAIVLDNADLCGFWHYGLPSPYRAKKSDLDSRPFEFISVTQEEADNFRRKYGGKKTDFDPNLHTLLISKNSLKAYFSDKLRVRDEFCDEFDGKTITDVYFGDNGFVLEVADIKEGE